MTDEKTIEPEAPATPEADPPITLKPAWQNRADFMEQIAKQHEDERSNALDDPDAPGADEPKDEGPVKLDAEDLGKLKVPFKVNGEETEKTLEEVVRLAQKNEAADRALAEAIAAKNEAEATRAKLEEQLKAAAEAPAAPAKSDAPAPDKAGAKAKLQEALTKMYEGDAEVATDSMLSAIETAISSGRTPATPEQLSDPKVVQKIAAQVKAQIDNDRAIESFQTDYQDLIGRDNPLATVADGFLNSRLAKGEPFHTALLAAGNDTREWIKGIAKDKGEGAGAASTDGASLAGKRERKAELSNPRPAGSPPGGGQSEPPMSSEASRSSVIQEMAAQRRGQATH